MGKWSPALLLIGLMVASALVAAQAGPGQIPGDRGQGRGMPPRDTSALDQTPRGTSILRGFVVDAETAMPIRRAQVRATAPGLRDSRLATTDAQGIFEIKDLPAGRYSLTASKGGFVTLQYGQRRPSEAGTPLDLGDGQLIEKVIIALPRGSVIAGRITDEFGDAMANAVVTAMRDGYAGGVRRLMPPGGQNARDTTDDLGQFRLFGLPPGDYIVSASFRGGRGEVTDPAGEPSGYAPTYYPGTPNIADAQHVRVDISQESTVTFALVATRLVHITGSVTSSQGTPVAGGTIRLAPADGRMDFSGQLSGGRTDAAGRFRIGNVAPGSYLLVARQTAGRGGPLTNAAGGEQARVPLAVGYDDVEGVVVITAPGARISGQVVTDSGARPSFRPQQLQVVARAIDPLQAGLGGGGTRVNDDWTFELSGLFEPRLLRANAPAGWSLKEVIVGGHDVIDVPLQLAPGQNIRGVQIVLTDRLTELSGRVADARGQAVVDATVVVFPADEQLWLAPSRFIQTARPDQEGRFQMRGLPPYGEYRILALQALEIGQAADPELLATLRDLASRLVLSEGESKAVEVRLTSQ